MKYSHPFVRDLAWVLSSPSLINNHLFSFYIPPNNWFREIYSHFESHLDDLDQNPAPLVAWCDQRLTKRLGHYYEALWSYWLEHNGRYQKVLENQQIQRGTQTLGEIDFIVWDREEDKYFHWEVALKFYLAYRDPSQLSSWYGLRANDKLDRKLNHLSNHQCTLLKMAEAKEVLQSKNIEISDTWVLMKGRVFYPENSKQQFPEELNPEHLTGWWLSVDSFREAFENHDYLWRASAKKGWLVSQDSGSNTHVLSEDMALNQLIASQEFPLCVSGLQSGREVERGFVLPGDWLENLDLIK